MQVVKIFQMIHDDGALIWEGIKIYVREACDAIIGWFTGAWDKIKSIVNSIKSAVSSVGGAMKSVGGKVVSGAKSILGIDDGVIAPNGQLVSTAPDDWLIATKNPQSLGAGAGGVTINLNGTFMSPKETMRALTDEMALELKRRLRI